MKGPIPRLSIQLFAVDILLTPIALLLGSWLRRTLPLGRGGALPGEAVSLPWTIFLLAVVVSWIRGLFYYVAITPNYLNIQAGPTETGEQVSREEYGTRIDTGDFLERLLGFGRLIVTFSDPHRQPTVLLISRIGRRARTLESIRGKLAIERHQEVPEV